MRRRAQELEKRKDRLSDLNRLIPWENFAGELEQLQTQERKSKAGRKAIVPLLLFKLLIL